MCVTKNDPLCFQVSSFYYYFIMQSSWISLEINIVISFIVIFFSFKRLQALQPSLHSFFSPVSKIMGYCCAEKATLQTFKVVGHLYVLMVMLDTIIFPILSLVRILN